MGMTKDDQSFRNMSLSFRGSERQPPSVLQMALRFSRIMERQSTTMSGNTETRLKRVVALFNQSKGLHVKHQIDAEKERTVLNLIIGTAKAGLFDFLPDDDDDCCCVAVASCRVVVASVIVPFFGRKQGTSCPTTFSS